MTESFPDKTEKLECGAVIQHGSLSERVYLMKLAGADTQQLLPELDRLVRQNKYGKIFAKIPASSYRIFEEWGFEKEAFIPRFYNGSEDAMFLGKYYDPARKIETQKDKYDEIGKITIAKSAEKPQADKHLKIRLCTTDDVEEMAQLYRDVFPSYPFAIYDPEYLRHTMAEHIVYFCIEHDGRIVALSSAEMDTEAQNVEMTDFATLPQMRGAGYAKHLLDNMESNMRSRGMITTYTIARAISAGINIIFARAGYSFGGRLVNNTNISGNIESMNVWYKTFRTNRS